MFGTRRTAENHIVMFDAVTNDSATTMIAGRCQRVDRTFERIERVFLAVHGDHK